MDQPVSLFHAGSSRGNPGDVKYVIRNPRGGGDKNKEVRGSKFTFLFQGKLTALDRWLHSQINVLMFMSKIFQAVIPQTTVKKGWGEGGVLRGVHVLSFHRASRCPCERFDTCRSILSQRVRFNATVFFCVSVKCTCFYFRCTASNSRRLRLICLFM